MEEGTGGQAGGQAGGKGSGETGARGTGAEGRGTNISNPRTLGRLVQNPMKLSFILSIFLVLPFAHIEGAILLSDQDFMKNFCSPWFLDIEKRQSQRAEIMLIFSHHYNFLTSAIFLANFLFYLNKNILF